MSHLALDRDDLCLHGTMLHRLDEESSRAFILNQPRSGAMVGRYSVTACSRARTLTIYRSIEVPTATTMLHNVPAILTCHHH